MPIGVDQPKTWGNAFFRRIFVLHCFLALCCVAWFFKTSKSNFSCLDVSVSFFNHSFGFFSALESRLVVDGNTWLLICYFFHRFWGKELVHFIQQLILLASAIMPELWLMGQNSTPATSVGNQQHLLQIRFGSAFFCASGCHHYFIHTNPCFSPSFGQCDVWEIYMVKVVFFQKSPSHNSRVFWSSWQLFGQIFEEGHLLCVNIL